MEIRAVPRLLAIVAFAAVLTGCSASASGGEPAAPRPESAPAAPPAAPDQPRPPDGGCQITATSTGSISSTGGSSRTASINGETSFACEDGPMLTIAAIDDAGVTFVGEDGERVTIAPGASGSVGGYAISVASVAGGTAEFQVLPA